MNEYNTQPLSPGERRKRMKRLKRKRMVRLTLVVAAAFLLLCIIVVPIISFVAFKVDDFQIEGKTRYTKEQIIEASGVSPGTNLLLMSAEKAQESIMHKLPFIESAVVSKSMPRTLVIKVSESNRVYAFELGGGNYLITGKSFKALETVSTPPEGSVLVKCAKPVKTEIGSVISFVEKTNGNKNEQDKILDLLTALDTAMDKTKMQNITIINLLNAANIRLLYQNRLLLRIGGSDSLESKLDLANKVIESEDEISGSSQYGTILLATVQKAFVETCDASDVSRAAIIADDSGIYKKKEETTTKKADQAIAEDEEAADSEENASEGSGGDDATGNTAA